jgi:hypothetical protein
MNETAYSAQRRKVRELKAKQDEAPPAVKKSKKKKAKKKTG